MLLAVLNFEGGCLADAQKPALNSFFKVKRLGDLDAMNQAHVIRFLVPFNKAFYSLDRGQQKGLSYEAIKLFEQHLNREKAKGHVKIKAVVIPTSRDRLLPDLVAGYGDIAIGNLTITPERRRTVDFTDPFFTDAREVVITPKEGPKLSSLFDLAGKEIFVRRSSSYHASLVKVNQTLQAVNKPLITITPAAEYLEDEDLLEMVNAGLLPMVVVDLHKAELWKQVFPAIKVHENIVVRSGGQIAWAIRKNSPLLKQTLNRFVKANRQGTLHFNMLTRRYLENASGVRNNTSEAEMKKFQQVVAILKQYANRYAFDWIMLGAMAYQESGLDQAKRSKAGAVGIMQVLPSTAADPKVNISEIEKLEPNIHAGTKYLRFLTDRYYADEEIDPLNQHLFAFAAYNAGPARIAGLRKEAAAQGLDRNTWFNNVELIAAQRIGRETVQYVANIYKYSIAYRLILRNMSKKQVGKTVLREQYAR